MGTLGVEGILCCDDHCSEVDPGCCEVVEQRDEHGISLLFDHQPSSPGLTQCHHMILERPWGMRAKIPLGRYSTADEVAGMVGYLVSDTAALVASQAINVCGGLGHF